MQLETMYIMLQIKWFLGYNSIQILRVRILYSFIPLSWPVLDYRSKQYVTRELTRTDQQKDSYMLPTVNWYSCTLLLRRRLLSSM